MIVSSNLKSKEVLVDVLVCNELGVENHYLFLESRVIQQVINYSRVFIVITAILVHNQKWEITLFNHHMTFAHIRKLFMRRVTVDKDSTEKAIFEDEKAKSSTALSYALFGK